MPYLTKGDRQSLISPVAEIKATGVKTAGEIQYLIAEIIDEFLQCQVEEKGHIDYQSMNDVMGALAGAQQEFYRMIVAPYEDQKINENGYVYHPNKYKYKGY